MATGMGSQESGETARLEFERQLVLQEYKTHHEEIFKWNTYSNQAVGAYLVLFSILATIVSQYKQCEHPGDSLVDLATLQRWIPIVALYASFVLLYVTYQFRFMMVTHNEYLLTELRRRMKLYGADAPIEWETFVINCRKPLTQWYYRWPVKLGINIIPFGVALFLLLWYLVKFFCEDMENLTTTVPRVPPVYSLMYFIFQLVVPILLLTWCCIGFKHLSRVEKGLCEAIQRREY